MGDENPIRTLGDYSKPSHEGYRNTIELPEGNNVVPLRSDTIRLVQNGCSFHGLRSEDPNQHLKDFLKLVDSLDLNGENRERTHLHLFEFSLRDQASNWLERLPAGSISIWEDLTTHFHAQFFPPGRTAKLRNDILMLLIQIFYDHVSFHLKCEIDRAAHDKLLDKNANESWEIIENLVLHDHERWNNSKDFVKPVKAISTSQGTTKMPDQRLLEHEDQINFLLKGPQPTPRPSSTHIPQAFVEAVSSNLRHKTKKSYQSIILSPFVSQAEPQKKVLIREEARYPSTKDINSISLIPTKEEDNVVNNGAIAESIMEPSKPKEEEPLKKVCVTKKVRRRKDGETTKSVKESITRNEEEDPVGVSSSHIVGYYLKHKINENVIEGLVENQKFNDSLSAARVGKIKQNTYNLLPKGPVHDAILKKRITRKEDIGGNFEIPCNIGGLKHTNALVDQGSDVNVISFSTYSKLTNERLVETKIRLSLSSHSYIYPLGIAKDVLVDVDGFVYLIDFMILDIKEDESRPFILGTPFMTTAKAVIKFDKGTITLKSGKSKISFQRNPGPQGTIKKGIKNDIEPIAPIMTVNRLYLMRRSLEVLRKFSFDDSWKMI
ncbi:MAK10-like protein [Tanacetum coccineum]|uniref:MAK10-like protein n=1 Tax=Tanacetum coccineum TaxID=301880 RepID=A0ABQ5HU96_9ASTR